MERIQSQGRALLALAFLLTSCTAGLEGGSTSTTFAGLTNALVEGPQTVDLYWQTNAICNSYQVYRLSSNDSSLIATATVPPVRLNQNSGSISSDTQYTFSIGCLQSDGTVSGLSAVKVITTWPQFGGGIASSLDLTGANPIVVLNWSYPLGIGTQYQIYAKLSTVPGDLSTWGLTANGAAGTGYSDTPICVTNGSKVRIGASGDCPSANLLSGQIYNFKVVAHYPDGSYSTDIIGNGTSQLMPATFTPPGCLLTQSGLGPDSSNSYLYLRCDVGTIGANVGSCPASQLSMKAYQAINGVKTLVSGTLTGNGTLSIQPQVSSAAANDRQITGLEIDYTCSTTSPATTSVVRYDGTSPQFPIPSLKFNNAAYDGAPKLSADQNPSHLGQSIAIGDFNCDGKPDMAVGMPLVTYNKPGDYLSSQNNETGMVKVYYDYEHSLNDYQILTFSDLPSYAHFGQSLAAGNVNRDVHQSNSQTDSNFYSCDDLIIGAPGKPTQRNFASTGAVYIFYGQSQRFQTPLQQSGLATNAPTCTGNYNNEVCAPVKLLPTMTSTFKVAPANLSEQALNSSYPSSFGFSVAFIRDFNADGYGDIAIGDPYCDWDGFNINNGPAPSDSNVAKLADVGCAYVFWGGPSGVQNVYVGNTPDNAVKVDGSNKFLAPFVKFYPPIPQPFMHFGWSISGGGDIDGRMPVPVQMNGTSNIILATGSDFVVGAPDYTYNLSNSYSSYVGGGSDSAQVATVWPASTDAPDPIVTQGKNLPYSGNDPALGSSKKISPPWNGAWAWSGQTAGASRWSGANPTPSNPKLLASTGIAFAYLGRSALQNYNISMTDNAFHRYPNQIGDASVSTPIDTFLSLNLQDRQNGSQFIGLSSTVTAANNWKVAPVLSFYNCGNRGSPGGNDGTANKYYTHYSCLAGRNNFSVIYPMLSASDNPVYQFGLNVAVAAPPEQNSIALFNLASAASASGYQKVTSGSNTTLQPLAQGNVHSDIRGVSEWEVGVKGLNIISSSSGPSTRATLDPNCEVFQLGSNQNPDSGSNCSAPATTYSASLARSVIKESYAWSLAGTGFNTAPSAVPTNDINRDGYADILISTGQQTGAGYNATVYTYFGNYAADFSYGDTAGGGVGTIGSLGGCAVNRLTTASTTGFAANNPGPTPAPFSTFATAAAGSSTGTKDWWIYGEYPAYQLPDPDFYERLAFLGDFTEVSASSISLSYPVVSRPANIGSGCYPQRNNSYLTTPSSLAAADVNNDGVIDGIIGLQNDSLNTGKSIVSYASSGGTTFGLSSDNPYTDGAISSSLAGSVVAGVNWKYIDETVIRDLLVGAIGFTNGTSPGAGRILAYTGSSSSTLSSISTSHFDDTNNSPNNLLAQYAKIIGDVNGDGYDDILIPVKRFNAQGNTYYDGIIYFGSPFGPMTTTVCNAKRALILKSAGGAQIDQSPNSSDCEATTGGATGVINNVIVRLPQYITSPTGVNPNWITYAYAAGDVDGDGKGDIVIIDNRTDNSVTTTQLSGIYLFFGTETGLKNGAPTMGASADHTPQLITKNTAIMGETASSDYSPGQSSYSRLTTIGSRLNLNSPYPMSNVPVVHGDFNGDGYSDIAIGIPGLSMPAYGGSGASVVNTQWHCLGTTISAKSDPSACGDASASPAVVAGVPGPARNGHGGVVIFYGGPHGVQTPLSTVSGLPTDFDIADGAGTVCTDFYGACKYGTKNLMDTTREVYGSMAISNGAVTINTSSTTTANGAACDPTSGNCYASIIRNPVYFNDLTGGDSFLHFNGMYFGSALTVGDMNGDGIDDLIVGFPNFSHVNFDTANAAGGPYGAATIFTSTAADPNQKGSVMIFYGAKGAGVVAPPAKSYLGDLGMGLDMGNSTLARANNPTFTLYPILPSSSGTAGTLDGMTENYKQFGINVTTGDFNGDGVDDIAVASGNGQIYVYYGPICNVDNNKTAMWSGAYAAHNIAVPITSVLTNGLGANDCSMTNLIGPFAPNQSAATAGNLVQAARKTLFPQMIYLNGSTTSNSMGSVLLSKRPIRTIPTATTPSTVIKNPGNLNGDPEATSDLIVGTYYQNDPNANVSNGKSTGIGYVLFGQKDPNAGGTMKTIPGLYVGNPTYNSAVINSTVSTGAYYTGSVAGTYYYYSPLLLKPHASDGTVEKFWLYPVTMGDVNGDGQMDLLMTTEDLQVTTNNTTTVNGGGFKLFY